MIICTNKYSQHCVSVCCRVYVYDYDYVYVSLLLYGVIIHWQQSCFISVLTISLSIFTPVNLLSWHDECLSNKITNLLTSWIKGVDFNSCWSTTVDMRGRTGGKWEKRSRSRRHLQLIKWLLHKKFHLVKKQEIKTNWNISCATFALKYVKCVTHHDKVCF